MNLAWGRIKILILISSCLFSFNLKAETLVNVITIDGGINPASADFIIKSIKKSEEEGAHLLVIKLSTPGGLLTSTRIIVQAIFDSEIPVAVYVSPGGANAGSAGVMVTLAAHIAAMAPGTNIGAAHPVSGTGKDIEDDMEEKVTNDAAAFAESIAASRGRNAKWAIRAVRESVSITAEKALEMRVIDFVAPSLSKLLSMINGKKVKVGEKEIVLNTAQVSLSFFKMNLKQKIVDILGNPNIAYILMMIGILGLYFELSHPGTIFPGVIGGICLILAFISLQALPINYGGLVLILLGIGFLIAEVFLPSFGILGISGIVAFVLGSIFLFDTESGLRISLGFLVPVAVTIGGAMLILVFLLIKSRLRKKVSGMESFIGKEGEVEVEIIPGKAGKIFTHGEYWNATSEEKISKGEKVVVIDRKGMLLKVKKQ